MSALFADLAEDWLTSFAPDVIGNADAPQLAAQLERRQAASLQRPLPLQRLAVPRPDGTARLQPLLHPAAQIALHRAVCPLKDQLAATLTANVFGYRRGADAGSRYADEWQRFSRYSRGQAEQSQICVSADVRRFLEHVSWTRALAAVEAATTSPQPALAAAAAGIRLSGLDCLPAGYADARLLGNVVLAQADRILSGEGWRWARWVDDYRLFAADEEQASVQIAALGRALGELGLSLNKEKTVLRWSANVCAEPLNPLGALYRPQEDAPETVRLKLRQAFATAAADPVGERKGLRFSLGRLEKTGDPIAVAFALGALDELPWEAPRLISYLAGFCEQAWVRAALDRSLRRAAAHGDAWRVARIGALVLRTGASARTLSILAEDLEQLQGTPAWGIALRLLALQSDKPLPAEGIDTRALVAAAADRGAAVPAWLCRLEPATVEAVEAADGVLPLPPLRSLL